MLHHDQWSINDYEWLTMMIVPQTKFDRGWFAIPDLARWIVWNWPAPTNLSWFCWVFGRYGVTNSYLCWNLHMLMRPLKSLAICLKAPAVYLPTETNINKWWYLKKCWFPYQKLRLSDGECLIDALCPAGWARVLHHSGRLGQSSKGF